MKHLFTAAHPAREDVIYLGDAVFVRLLSALARGQFALVRVDGDLQGWPWSSTVEITDAGRAVLEGRMDRVKTVGIDRWLGGEGVAHSSRIPASPRDAANAMLDLYRRLGLL